MSFLRQLQNIRLILQKASDKIIYSNRHVIRNKTNGFRSADEISSQKVNLHQLNKTVPSEEKLLQYSVGDKICGFTIENIEQIPEFQLTAVKLIHDVTGGEYLHIDRDDSNNVFSVLFRTTPTDSTGLPHILEHTTLCGSKKFPVRDPFFKMLNRSLATFMNAMTAPDWTLYPFSTQNSKDYQNLMSVYLDAVFRPNLKEIDFRQEGWRLEHEDPKNPESPIILKGVVYNEMKGVFADNQNIFDQAVLNSLLPSHTYSVCSGGDPADIPNLTHQDLVNFHKKHYSPFNAKYYSYGDIPFTKHLDYINQEYLNHLERNQGKAVGEVPLEKRWAKPVRKHITCRFDPLEADEKRSSFISVSYLCCPITDVDETFLLKVLSELLVSGPNASFYKTLIEPNIGSDYVRSTGYESQTKDTFFSVGLQGVSEKDFDKIIKIIDGTIDEVIENGFEEKNLEAVLHSIELGVKHQSSNFGLGLMFNLSSLWNHEGEVFKYLRIDDQVKNLRKNIAKDPKYLQNKVKQYFKENNHKLVVTMSPDPDHEKKWKQKEEEILREKLKNLDEENKKKIYEDGLRLLEEQKNVDASCLPTLRITDLKKDIERVKHFEEKVSNIPVRMIPQPTNGITYFRGLINTNNLREDLKPFLPLFALVSTKMGTKKHDFKKFDQIVALKTGGLNLGTHLIEDSKQLNRIEDALSISSYCLNRNVNDMFDLWAELFREVDFTDENRFETLVRAHAAELANSVVASGHRYAMLASSSLVSSDAVLKERNGGLTYVDLIKSISQDPVKVLPKIIEICNFAMSRPNLRCSLNLLEDSEKDVLNGCSRFIGNIPNAEESRLSFRNISAPKIEAKGIYHDLPLPVSYSAKTIVTVPYEHDDFPALRIMTNLVTMKYLHPEIREKGGAYGGGLNISSTGNLNFYSYRDPNPFNSLQTYDNTIEWLKKGNFTDEEVDQAKLGVFQQVDAPICPGDKGMRNFLYGISDETYQQHRLKLMKVTKDEIIALGEKYLNESVNKNKVGRAVIGPENKSITSNSDQSWRVVTQS